MKKTQKKICMYNQLDNTIQITTYFKYNYMKTKNVNNIIKEIRLGLRSKQNIYLYGFKYSNKYGRCGVISNISFTTYEEYNKFLENLKNKYRFVECYFIEGDKFI